VRDPHDADFYSKPDKPVSHSYGPRWAGSSRTPCRAPSLGSVPGKLLRAVRFCMTDDVALETSPALTLEAACSAHNLGAMLWGCTIEGNSYPVSPRKPDDYGWGLSLGVGNGVRRPQHPPGAPPHHHSEAYIGVTMRSRQL
jgi:hypothetical protein